LEREFLTVLFLYYGTLLRHMKHFSFGGSIAPYSDAVQAGPFYFLSGKIPVKEGKIVGANVKEQTEVAFENLFDTIAKLECKPSDIVKITAFLTDLSDFAAFNDVYKVKLSDPYPARSCVMVKQLPMNSLVEIEATLYKK
jgi:2-iminobutanoate/2-iminopropanoate deaminase